jgi:uncharacterized protein YfcZ (UPF0381/DUF406 family)
MAILKSYPSNYQHQLTKLKSTAREVDKRGQNLQQKFKHKRWNTKIKPLFCFCVSVENPNETVLLYTLNRLTFCI